MVIHWIDKPYSPADYTVVAKCGEVIPETAAVEYGGSVTCNDCHAANFSRVERYAPEYAVARKYDFLGKQSRDWVYGDAKGWDWDYDTRKWVFVYPNDVL